MEEFKLNDGNQIPMIGFGTYKIKGYQGRSYIVAGSDDDQVPLASLEMMAKKLKQGELLQMRGAGHDYREEDWERAGMLLRTWVLTGLN